MRADWVVFRALSRPLQLLLFSQFAFNVGFYLVVPFLASYLETDLRLSGALIGLILGLRTFSQQGLFFLGGAVTDWLGVKPVLLLGIAVRIVGFLTLAGTQNLGLIVLGVVLIGIAAALFSPASESAIVGLAGVAEAAGGPRRTQVLSVQQVFSQAGSAVGPALGGALLFVTFQVTSVVAAGLFALIGLMHLLWLPSGLRVGARSSVLHSLGTALRNRGFLAFAGVNAVMLVGYNQMYLALPVELTRIGADSATITWYFLIASIFVIAGQCATTRVVDRLPAVRVFQLGFLVAALAFLLIAAVAWVPSQGGLLGALPIVGFVLLLHLATMITAPRARDIVARMAREKNLGAHMGVMASAGGLAVLLTGGPIGSLLEAARTPGPAAALPWLVLAALPVLSAVLVAPTLRRSLP